MPVKQKKKKTSSKKLQRGTVGSFFVFGVLALLIVVGLTAVGGLPPQSFPDSGQNVIPISPTPDVNHDTLQLKTFGYITIAPTPVLGANSLCNDKSKNTEPEILEAFSPLTGTSVGSTGQIKVWVVDELPPMVAPGLTTDASGSGTVINPGNQSALASDGYLYDPALYVDKPVEQGGSPAFPNYVKGVYDPTPPNATCTGFNCYQQGKGVNGATPDPLPAGSPKIGCGNPICYEAEYIWDVSKLGLSTGTHQAEFLIHDGDRDRGIGCVTIKIQ